MLKRMKSSAMKGSFQTCLSLLEIHASNVQSMVDEGDKMAFTDLSKSFNSVIRMLLINVFRIKLPMELIAFIQACLKPLMSSTQRYLRDYISIQLFLC